LPTWNGVQLVSANSSIIPSLQVSGFSFSGTSSNPGYVNNAQTLIEPSVSYLTFQAPATTTLSKSTGSAITATGIVLSINARIPIAGWQNSNLIIAQLSGLESCSSTLECTDTFSAKVSSTGIVSDENIDWLSGNATVSSGLFTFSLKTGLVSSPLNCTASTNRPNSDATVACRNVETSTNSSLAIRCENTSTGTSSATAFHVICQKQGVDYIGKTAKAVASDQNISTPGTIKSTICSAKISSTGVISDQKGGCFASCTNATTPVCTFTSNYWVSGQVPNCWHSSDGFIPESKATTSTTFSGIVINTAGAVQTIGRLYFCHGERQ
jgi:hypothetical protein